VTVRKSLLLASLIFPSLIDWSPVHSAPVQSPYEEEVRAGVEQIYVFRTTRTRHESGATPACASAPFASVNEDYYSLWSLELRANDSKVDKTHEREVGGFTACFGPLARGQPLQMYALGRIARIPWKGAGECLALESQPPVKTAIAFSCRLNLSGLPADYSGGFAVSSTLAPSLGRNQPPTAHVPGYLSTSIVVLRLWKRPATADRR
jgi:hypothetical protein